MSREPLGGVTEECKKLFSGNASLVVEPWEFATLFAPWIFDGKRP